MTTIDEMHEILVMLIDELPEQLFKDLNGGVSLVPDTMYSPQDQSQDLFILAQYHSGGFMGRYITINYGSFMEVYPTATKSHLTERLRHVLRHEFRHHMESLAGDFDLEKVDKEYLDDYLESKGF